MKKTRRMSSYFVWSVCGPRMTDKEIQVWQDDSRRFESSGIGWYWRPQGYKQLTSAWLLVFKGLQPWKLGRTSQEDNQENRDWVTSIRHTTGNKLRYMWVCEPMKEEQGIEHVKRCIKMIPAGSQSTEFAPTAIILLSARTQDVAIHSHLHLGLKPAIWGPSGAEKGWA